MNVAGAKAAPKAKAGNQMNERIMHDNVILRQKLSRVMELKERLLGDKAESEAALNAARNELVAAYGTIAALKAKVAELTESFASASNAKKNRKQKAEQADGVTEASEG